MAVRAVVGSDDRLGGPVGVIYGANTLGAAHGTAARLRRLRYLLGGRYGMWLRAQTQALWRARDLLDPEAQALLQRFSIGLYQGGWHPGALGIRRQKIGRRLVGQPQHAHAVWRS